MKILLVSPPFYRLFGGASNEIPLGLCYLAAYIKGSHKVKIFNADFDSMRPNLLHSSIFRNFELYVNSLKELRLPVWEKIERRVKDYDPDVIGISVLTGKYSSAMNVARICKQINPEVKIVVGGPHPTIDPVNTLKNKDVDIVVVGEGEVTFSEICDRIENNEPLNAVKGIFSKQNDKIEMTPPREMIKDLDTLLFPAKDCVIDSEKYPPNAFGFIMTGRGCPHHCIFCASHKIWTRKVRLRSPHNIVHEMIWTSKQFGTKHFRFWDDSFTLDKKRIHELCSLLRKQQLDFSWDCDTRVDLIDEKLVGNMKNSGCQSIAFGIESGDPCTLKKLKKGITLEQARYAVQIAKKHGIRVSTYFMIGFPWETKESMITTYRFSVELEPHLISVCIATPYPGTELWDLCKEDEPSESTDWSFFFQQSPKINLTNLKDEEFSRITRHILNEADKYNRAMERNLYLKNPLVAMKKVIKDPRGALYYLKEHLI